MIDSNLHRCLNCQNEYQATYCPDCGQAAATGRLEFREIVGDLVGNLVSFDSGLLRTAKGMTRNPGKVCLDYVGGRRVPYASPLRYTLTILAITLVVYRLTGYDPAADMTDSALSIGATEFQQRMLDFAVNHPSLTFFIPLPLFCLAFRWMFRKSGHNLAEITVFNLFVAAHFSLFVLPLEVLLPVSNLYNIAANFLLPAAYFTWAGRTFFQEPVWKIVIKVLAVIAGLIVLTFLGAILAVILLGPGTSAGP